MRKNKYMIHRAGIRKCLAVGLTAAMCTAMLAGCSAGQSTGSTSDTGVSTSTDADIDSENGDIDADTNSKNDGTEAATGSQNDGTDAADAQNTSTKTEMTVEEMQAAIDDAMSEAGIDITDMFTKRDLSGNYEESEAVKITLSEKTATCDSSNVQIEEGVVTIKAAGGSSGNSGDNKGGFGGGPGRDMNGNTSSTKADDNGQSNGTDSDSTDTNTPPEIPDSNGQSSGMDSDSTDTNTTPAKPDDIGQPGGLDMSGRPGMGGADMNADYDAYILITGGNININADGDGIDSNGYLGIAGGNVYVLGPSNNGNGALDYGIYAAITGGEMVAVGGSGMAQGFGDQSAQCSALVNFDEWIDAGEMITLTDSNGNKLLTYKAAKKFGSVLISTSDMKQGETYTLTAGDQTSTFAMEDVTYSEGSGGVYGSGGDPGNGGMQRPDSTGDGSGNGGIQRPDGNFDDGGMQKPDSTGDGSDAGDGHNSDNGQNGGQDSDSQTTETLKNAESISI